ncbi:universal stress protein [Kitasatospora purpeofusca]|uniref:universal stress protein n=1 Tax=Kitasatospora purpeofusca TaxID=67352 RepID=UPI00386E3759|nr:universal stress protein [Kitasatospora purpeofusca]
MTGTTSGINTGINTGTTTGTTRVIVGLSGSLGSLAALYRAVAEAARREAVLVPVAAWSPSDGDQRGPRPLSELEHAARRRIDTAFEQAFGGYPADLVIHPLTVRGCAGPALVSAVTGPADRLVIGTGRHGRLGRLLPGSVPGHCHAHATCPVVAVSPSELLERLEFTARSGAPLPFAAGHHGTGRPLPRPVGVR